MDFELSQDQIEYRDEVIRFAQENLNHDVRERDANHEFSQEAWRKCADFGIQGLPMPEEYGGRGANPLTTMVALEALGYGCADGGLIFSLNAHMWHCEITILRFGSEEQKKQFLPGLCDGSLIGAPSMTEPGSGSDAFSLTTEAVRNNDGFVLNGTKSFTANAPIANLFLVYARTDPTKGFAGISAFLVDRETPGLAVGQAFRKMGLRTSPTSKVVFTDCEVARENMLGREGAGMAIFNASMDWERSYILASAVGSMQRQLERSIAYAKERRQFNQSIGKFQAVANRIVDMKVRLETSRLLLYRLGWLKSQGKTTVMDSAIVKLYLSNCLVQSSLDGLQNHGSYGYIEEYELEREVRDAIGSRIYSGTSDIQRNIIAGHLGL